MKFERLNEGHVLQVAKIEQECFSNPWSEFSIRNEIDATHSVFIVALDEMDKVCGYGSMHTAYEQCYINNIAVKSECRQKGIATKLLEILVDIAREIDGEFVSLEVRKSNENAIKLYEKMSFKAQGLRKNYYEKPSEDAVIMTREIK